MLIQPRGSFPENTPLKEEVYGHGGFPAEKNAIFLGAHKIGAAISGPRIADTNFTDTRIFLNIDMSQPPHQGDERNKNNATLRLKRLNRWRLHCGR